MAAKTTEPKPALTADEKQDCVNVFKMASELTRLNICLLLENGELNVTQLCENLGIEQPAMSHHLALMRITKVITARRQGKFSYYGLDKLGKMIVKTARAIA